MIFSRADPIIWARDAYVQTGIGPYVHPAGARVPSLRRLYEKRPYFTNGSAPDLDSVLRRARLTGDRFLHDGGDASAGALAADERAVLRSFLDLL